MRLVFAFLLSGRFVAAFLHAGSLILLARLTDPINFAIVSAALGVAVFVSAATDLGVTPASSRETVVNPSHLRGLRRLNSEVAVAVGVPAFAGMWAFGSYLQSPTLVALSPLGLWLVTERLAEFRFAVLIGLGRGAQASISLILRKAVPLAALLLVLTLPGVDVVLAFSLGYLGGSLCAVAVGQSMVAAVVGSNRYSLSRRSAFAISSPFWANSLSAQARQLDVLVVALVGGASVAAVYAPAARLVSPLLLIPTTLAQAALPAVARDPDDRTLVRRMFALGLIPTFLIYSVGVFVAPILLPALLGSVYEPSVPVLQILLMGLTAAGVSALSTSVLQARGFESYAALTNVSWSVGSLALLVGGAAFGPVGCAIALALGFVLQATTLEIVRRRRR